MPDILNINNNNPLIEVLVTPLPKSDANVLVYGGSSGKFSSLIPDEIFGGRNLHEGNPIFLVREGKLITSASNSLIYNVETKKIISPIINRGIIKFSNSNWFWDELFTTPIGIFGPIVEQSNTVSIPFIFTGNNLSIIFPSRAIPKIGDVIILQKVSDTDYANIVINNDYINGITHLKNTGLKTISATIINTPTFNTVNGVTTFNLVLDKEIKNSGFLNHNWAVILLNRNSTGIQKDLFSQTFQQYEIWRNKALGDQINNNQYNYAGVEYIGLQNLLSDLLPSPENKFKKTPFIVLDIDQEIKDRFYDNYTDNSGVSVTINLGSILKDNGDRFNLVTFGPVKNDLNIGNFFPLKESTDSNNPPKTLGYVLNDLRIIIITDPELVTSLSYNSNRNNILVDPIILSPESLKPNHLSTLSADIINLTIGNDGRILVQINKPHGLSTGDAIVINNVYIIDQLNNFKLSKINQKVFIQTTIDIDKFYIYQNVSGSTVTNPFLSDGVFQQSNGFYGQIKGITTPFDFFFTYVPNDFNLDFHDLVLPYASLTDFNFSDTTPIILKIPGNVKIIIGKWTTDISSNKPFEVIGYSDVKFLNKTGNPSETFSILKSEYTSGIDAIAYDITNIFKIAPDVETNMKFSTQKWLLANVTYQTKLNVYRGNIEIDIPSGNWNSSKNPTYSSGSKYISEIAIVQPDDNTPLIYTKICPAIEKRNDLDLQINISLDW